MSAQLPLSSPADSSPSTQPSRRGFLAGGCALCAALAGSALLGCGEGADSRQADPAVPPQPVRLDLKPSGLPAAGEATTARGGGKPFLVLRRPEGQLVAFSAICTHQGCPVRFEADKDHLFCPCHQGIFDPTTGQVLGGPPERPLPRYEVIVAEDAVTLEPAA